MMEAQEKREARFATALLQYGAHSILLEFPMHIPRIHPVRKNQTLYGEKTTPDGDAQRFQLSSKCVYQHEEPQPQRVTALLVKTKRILCRAQHRG